MLILQKLFRLLRQIVAIPIFGVGLYIIISSWINLGKMFFTSMEHGSIIPIGGAAITTLAAFISGKPIAYRCIRFFWLIDVAGIIAWLNVLPQRSLLYLKNFCLRLK